MAAPGDRRHPPAQTLVEYFDHRAGGYDRQLWMERWALATAARLARPAAGARVVDLATGTGALAAAILDRQPRIGGLVAVDAAPHMLERAARRLGVPNPRVRLVTADVRGVPLPDGAADLVSVGYLLHLLSPPVRGEVLAEARRLLRPGGRLVCVVHGSPPGRGGAAYRAVWRVLARTRPDAIVGEGPMADLAPVVARGGLVVEASRRIPADHR